jgi:hypothetical protein
MDQLIFIWIVFAAAATSMARSKGRNIYLWIGISLLIGPFAVLIVALLKTTPKGDSKYY